MTSEGSQSDTRVRDPLEPGAVGPYRIVERIGAGGMGEVYLAIDMRLGRRVALKFLPPDRLRDRERAQRFRHEARAASALNHPNILTVYEFGELGDAPYIATEYVEGETLRQRLQRGRMPLQDVVSVATQIVSALAAAHAAGVIHRDVKPENVMIRRDGYVKVVDFGLAKLTDPGDSAPDASTEFRTNEAVVKGTPRYMSPEQVLGSSVDARSDVWSFGVVLYEMLTGRRPFENGLDEPAALDAPDEFRRIVVKALRKDRRERYQSASELLSDLQKMEHAGGWSTRTRRIAVGSAAGLAIAVVASLFVWNRRPIPIIAAQSVAVLPFVNLSGDPANDFLSDGMTEELIDSLAHVPELKVVSRTSSFALKGAKNDVREVAEKLGVGSVVEGSVRKAGNKVRVTAQLVNAKDGYRVWSDSFERDMSDVFAIEGEIASAVANSLRSQLGAASHVRRPRDMVAYELYIKGRQAAQRRTRESREQAILYLQEAIARDPSFSDAYAGLAEIYAMLDHPPAETTLSANQTYALALEASRRALALDPNCAEADGVAGHVLMHQGKFLEAEKHLRRAIRLNPNSARSHLFCGILLSLTQRHAEGKAHLLRARELDPLASGNAYAAANILMQGGDFSAAADFAREAVQLEPDVAYPYLELALIYSLQGKRREAQATLDAIPEKAEDRIDAARAFVEGALGDTATATALLKRAEREQRKLDQSLMMKAWAAAGDRDKAWEWLEKYVKTSPGMARVNLDLPPHPAFAAFRNDPRFQQTRRELGLPPLVDSR